MNDLAVGDTLESIQLPPVTRLDLIRYAGASGDYNPIHTIDKEAQKAGLPGVIAHGMWTMGNVGRLFSPYMSKGFITDFAIRFKGMVFLDDQLTLKATLKEQAPQMYTFDVVAENQENKPVVKGKVVFRFHSA